jgi:type IV pilus assembly protein PilB
MERKRLGQLLMEAGFISRQKLSHALNEQKISIEKLGKILVRRGYITEDNLFQVYDELKIISIQVKQTFKYGI